MNLPWHLGSDLSRAPTLFELADGRFQVVSPGALVPVMYGYGYLLVEQRLAEFLAGLEIERVSFEQATLLYPSTGEEVKTHVRLRVGQFFKSQDIRDLALDGLRILTLSDEYYFVSAELKAKLEQASFSYLRFSEGLAGFAASTA